MTHSDSLLIQLAYYTLFMDMTHPPILYLDTESPIYKDSL
jgi:hypothetical protein